MSIILQTMLVIFAEAIKSTTTCCCCRHCCCCCCCCWKVIHAEPFCMCSNSTGGGGASASYKRHCLLHFFFFCRQEKQVSGSGEIDSFCSHLQDCKISALSAQDIFKVPKVGQGFFLKNICALFLLLWDKLMLQNNQGKIGKKSWFMFSWNAVCCNCFLM